ncbi:MAG TPA: hypothetical protein VGC86_03070 [Afipia sp.]
MVALLLAGTIVLCAGLLTVVFGIPIKEFSFGNTMILSGAVIACTGIVLIGLSFVVRELKNLARHLDEAGVGVHAQPALSAAAPADAPRARTEPAQAKAARGPSRPSAKQDVLFSRDEEIDADLAAEIDRLPPQAPSLSPLPQWSDEPDVRARSAPPRPPERANDRAAESGERRRDILFSSSRREHERDQVNSSSLDFPHAADAHPDRGAPDPFEAGWPPVDRTRPEPDFAAEARSSRAPRNGGARQSPRRNEAASVTVVKSGVVDAMAYSLYSDGSIEAQMPEGMVRFESIDELRAHLDQRG